MREYSSPSRSITTAARCLPLMSRKSLPPWNFHVPSESVRGTAAPGARMPRIQIHGSSVIATERMLSRGITRSSRFTASTFSARVRWISRRSG